MTDIVSLILPFDHSVTFAIKPVLLSLVGSQRHAVNRIYYLFHLTKITLIRMAYLSLMHALCYQSINLFRHLVQDTTAVKYNCKCIMF